MNITKIAIAALSYKLQYGHTRRVGQRLSKAGQLLLFGGVSLAVILQIEWGGKTCSEIYEHIFSKSNAAATININ